MICQSFFSNFFKISKNFFGTAVLGVKIAPSREPDLVSVTMFVLAEALAQPLSYVFVGYDGELTNITVRAFYIYSCCFLLSGFSIFGSSFFTALNDGLVSALIAFLRTLVFQVIAVLCLPLVFELNGIWISVIVAEIMSIFVTLFFFIAKRKKYNY